MIERPARPRALLVGAYERDNFGDLLFLLVSERYLSDAGYDVVAAAPLPADMGDLLDRKVAAYAPLLESETFDQVWTVGGEVGGTRVPTALWMSASTRIWSRYEAAAEPQRAAMRRELFGAELDSPYLPRLSQFPPNVATPAVLSSVGLAGAGRLGARERERVVRILREATAVSVRDRLSSELLDQCGVEHVLAPDVVHTIRRTRPRPAGEQPGGTALVQASARMIRTVGAEDLAAALADSRALAPYPIRLFAAGLAPNHDSLEDYARLVDLVRARTPGRDIEVLDASRRPWDLVDEIRRASLWVGGSLHGRIVASAYDVPRVSFAKRKLDTYALTWDPRMPYGTTPATLDDHVRRALGRAAQDAAAGTGERLAELADRSIRGLVASASGATALGTTQRRFAAAERLVADRDRRLGREVARLRSEVARLEGAQETHGPVRPAAGSSGPVGRVRRAAGRTFRGVQSALISRH